MRGIDQSLWYHTVESAPQACELRDTHAVDVAVIGGGILGLSAALHLSISGIRAAVVEADVLGSGASGRNGGFVVPHFSKSDPEAVVGQLGETGERLVSLVGYSGQRLFDLIARHGIDCDAAQRGWYQPAHSHHALRAIESRVRQWAARGQPVTLLDAAETEKLTGATGYLGSWHHAGGGTLHPLKLVHGLARAAQAGGARLFDRSVVTELKRNSGHWHLRTTEGELIAEQVLVCTNGLSRGLLPRLAHGIVPARIYQAATEPIPVAARRHLLGQGQCLSDTQMNLFAYRFDADWRLITGLFAGLRDGMDRQLAGQMSRRLQSTLNLTQPPRIEFVWSGTASVGPSYLPSLVEVDSGVVAGSGCNGRGVALSVELGRIMAQAVRDGRWRDLPVPLSPLHAVRNRPLSRLGARWYPLYGSIRDRLDRLAS
jgi:glycine/D-amino acid oxidase-like deaminating enzyme